MKYFIFSIVFIFTLNFAFGQSIMLTPNSASNSEVVKLKKDGIGFDHTNATGSIRLGTYVDAASAYIQTHTNHSLNFVTNNGDTPHMTILTNGKVGIGTTTVSTNEILEVNGRMRLRRGAFASGLWLNNSVNGTNLTDGAFIGLNNETTGSETAGFWLNGAFRFWVDRTGNTTQNSSTVSNLAGTGTRNVYADANGTLTTVAQTHTLLLLPNSFVLNSNDETVYISSYNSPAIGAKIINSGLSNSSFESQLQLPNGAIVTNVTFFYYDNTAPNIRFILSRDSFEDNISNLNYVDVTSTGTLNSNQSISTNTNFTISENKIYHMSVLNSGGSAWDVNLRFRGIKITYTL